MFRKEYSLGMRIWHWSNSFVIFLLLMTVFLRKIFFGQESKNIVISKAQEMGVLLTDPQAKDIARAVRNLIWQWHPIIGFVAIGLLLFRVGVYYFQSCSLTVSDNGVLKPLMYKVIKKMHMLFYFILGIMGITGFALYWEDSLHLSKSISHNIQEVHEALLWFFIVFIISHVVGVIKAEQGEDKGLVSDMINGGKK